MDHGITVPVEAYQTLFIAVAVGIPIEYEPSFFHFTECLDPLLISLKSLDNDLETGSLLVVFVMDDSTS
jgi:hypothetical protein